MNLWQQFQQLLPEKVTRVGTVISVSNQQYTVSLPTGGVIVARSASNVAIGTSVFVQSGNIIGVAPDLGNLIEIEV